MLTALKAILILKDICTNHGAPYTDSKGVKKNIFIFVYLCPLHGALAIWRNMHGGGGKCIKILVGSTSRVDKLQTPKNKWEDNIKMGLSEM
jgi:hypothetical protein